MLASLLQILGITTPIFLVIALGYLAVRLALVSRDGIKVLATFVLYFALPALLFKALSSREFSEILNVNFLLVYGLAALLVFVLAAGLARVWLKRDLCKAAVIGLGSSFSNSLMIGLPIVLELFGEPALAVIAMVLLVENLLTLPVTLTLAELGYRPKSGLLTTLAATLSTVAKSPIIIGISLGLAFSVLSIPTPAVAAKVIDMLALSAPALALFVIGGNLTSLSVQSQQRDLALVTAFKLLVHPLLAVAMIWLAAAISPYPPMDAMWQQTTVILAALPMFAMFVVIGQKYELGEFSAASLMLTTVCGFFSLTLLIWLLQTLPILP